MDVETKLALANAKPTQEIVTQEELRSLFETNSKPRHYIGLEISGKLHVGSLLVNGAVVNNLIKAGVHTQVFLADWHSVINNKMNSDWEKIQAASKYFEEAFKFYCPGVHIVRASELFEENPAYWGDVLKFSKQISLARSVRCLTIMGRSESEKLDLAQYFYPPMQAVDIHYLKADIAHAGMDQRKIHMLAREVFPSMGWTKPIALHHGLLPGLSEPVKQSGDPAATAKADEVAANKMSKSKPESTILIHDSADEIKKKMSKAYCPDKVVEGNPVLALASNFWPEGKSVHIVRPEKFGGNVEFQSYAEMEAAFLAGKLHAMDLKTAVAARLDELIAPVRGHFEKKKELLAPFA